MTRAALLLGLAATCKPSASPTDELGAMDCMDHCLVDGRLDRECYEWCNASVADWQRWRDRELPNWRELSTGTLERYRTTFLAGHAAGAGGCEEAHQDDDPDQERDEQP